MSDKIQVKRGNTNDLPLLADGEFAVTLDTSNVYFGANGVNQLITSTLGEVRMSFLDETTFQSQAGTGWVLCDGRDVTGSAYATLTSATTVPDMRAVSPRGKDNGRGLNPDGDLTLGTYQADMYAAHTHGVNDPTHTHSVSTNAIAVTGGSGGQNGGNFVNPTASITILAAATGVSIQSSGGSETRTKAVTINFFIRVN